MENKKHYLFDIKPILDTKASLVVVEENKQLPFKPKRFFYEYNFENDCIRGNHANIDSQFCFIAVVGSCHIKVDDGTNKALYVLDSPTKVLYLDKMVWKTMDNFSKDCVLLVISDCLYNSQEYI